MSKLVLILALGLAGCGSHTIDAAQYERGAQYCKDHGYGVDTVSGSLDGRVYKVRCKLQSGEVIDVPSHVLQEPLIVPY